MSKLLSLLRILFIERRLPSKGYALLKKLGFTVKTRKICTKEGLILKGFDNTIYIYEEVWRGAYDIEGFEIKRGMNVIDVGANQGFFSVYGASKGAKVYSFEPDRENYKILRWNIKRNKLGGLITALNVAVSNKDGVIKLCIPINKSNEARGGMISTTSSFISTHSSDFDKCKVVTVKCVNFNSFLRNSSPAQWDLVKIDCEGAEYEILTCLSRGNLDKIDRIVMETHAAGYDDKELARFLKEAGFKIVYFKEIAGNNTGFIKAVKNG